MLLEGLHIPLTTPFHPDGRLALHKLASNVERYSKTPAAGLIVLGPSSEPTLLSDDETREVLRTVAQSAAPEKVLTANISRDSVHATLALANFAAEQHYDAVLLGVPSVLATEFQLSYRSLTNDLRHQVESRLRGQRTFFQCVADRAPLPVVLLHVDHRSIGVTEVSELASHPNIIGIVGAGKSHTMQRARISGVVRHTANIKREVTVTSTFAPVTRRMAAMASTTALLPVASLTTSIAIADPLQTTSGLRTRSKSVGFQTIAARADIMLDAINSGAAGISPSFAAAAPQACYEVFAAWKDADLPLAEEKQSRLIAAAKLAEASPSALKYACDLNGYYGGSPRLPHLPLTVAQRDELEEAMKPLRN